MLQNYHISTVLIRFSIFYDLHISACLCFERDLLCFSFKREREQCEDGFLQGPVLSN